MATTQALYCATLTSPCTRRRKLLLAGASSGRIFGLSPDDVGFLLGLVHVPRQVKIVGSQLVFDAPKGGKSRDVPLPESVALELAAHLEAHPAKPVALPLRDAGGQGGAGRPAHPHQPRERTAQPQLQKRQGVEARPARRRPGADSGERRARPTALVRLGPPRRRGEHPCPLGLPGPIPASPCGRTRT